MRYLRFAKFVPVVALTLGLAPGCSEPTEVEFKPTDTKQFDQMKEQMIKGMMKGKAAPKAAPAAAPAPAPAEKK